MRLQDNSLTESGFAPTESTDRPSGAPWVKALTPGPSGQNWVVETEWKAPSSNRGCAGSPGPACRDVLTIEARAASSLQPAD